MERQLVFSTSQSKLSKDISIQIQFPEVCLISCVVLATMNFVYLSTSLMVVACIGAVGRSALRWSKFEKHTKNEEKHLSDLKNAIINTSYTTSPYSVKDSIKH